MNEGLVGEFAEFCFGLDVSNRKGLHYQIIQELKRFFHERGFKGELEAEIYYTHRFKKSNRLGPRHGFIDIAARKDDLAVAVEFDRGTHIKHNSVEKLLQYNANLIIGVVKGKPSEEFLQGNIKRVLLTAKTLNITDKKFWLIIICEKVVRDVQL